MSTINALSAPSASLGVQAVSRPLGRPGGGALDTAATALGVSRDVVINALRQGNSLDDLAEARGVSHDDLVSALRKDMPDDLANGGRADQIAERIASQKGLPGRRPIVHPAPSRSARSGNGTGVLGSSLTAGQQVTLQRLSDLLGTDSGTLLSKLRAGTSLSDLTAAAGVSSSALASILQDGLLLDARV